MTTPRIIPLIIACALFMENMDGTVLATSLPAIAQDLHQDPIALKLALTSYLLSLAIFIPASGWLADRYGSQSIFRAAIFIFTLGSILCGLSSTLGGFVAARFFQGLGGAMMVPVGRLVLLRVVPKAELVQALAYLTAPAMFGPLLGPPLGGFITTYLHWRFIFWINVPIGILGLVLAALYVPDIKERAIAPFDAKGFALSGLGLGGVMYGLTVLGRGFIPLPLNMAMLVVGALALVAYVLHARRTEHPILDFSLFKTSTFFVHIVSGFLFRIGIGAIPLLLPLLLQIGFGFTPFASGSLTFAAAAGALTMKFAAQPILKRFGFRRVLIVNGVVSSVFIASSGLFQITTPHMLVFAVLLVGGFFRSLQFTAINAIGYADIGKPAMSRATSLSSVAQQLSLSCGVAIGAAVIELLTILHEDSAIRAGDITPAFFVVALFSLSSVAIAFRLDPKAGAEMSGHGNNGNGAHPDTESLTLTTDMVMPASTSLPRQTDGAAKSAGLTKAAE